MGFKILVVDDEKYLRETLKDFFELDGYEVVEASSGRMALEIIGHSKFDLVVTDVRMPQGDGIELAKNISALDGPKPKIIFVSGYTDISEQEAREIGVLQIVMKPFRPEELVSIAALHLSAS